MKPDDENQPRQDEPKFEVRQFEVLPLKVEPLVLSPALVPATGSATVPESGSVTDRERILLFIIVFLVTAFVGVVLIHAIKS